MWLTGYIAKENSPKSKCGEVVKSDDNTVNVFSSVEQSNVKVALPYGLYSVPVVGENSVIIPTENGNVVVGVCNNNSHNFLSVIVRKVRINFIDYILHSIQYNFISFKCSR